MLTKTLRSLLWCMISLTWFVGCDGPEAPRIVFTSVDGRTLTLDELREEDGDVAYEVVGGAPVPPEARALHEQGREAGSAQDLKKALDLLQQAADAAPEWPYPVYDMAYSHLLLGDAETARKLYRKTIEMAPRGFFTAFTALDALDREARGDLPPGTYLIYQSLEWTDGAAKAKIVHQLTKESPTFAPGWKAAALLAENDADRQAALDRGLAANPDPETAGVLLINKALLLENSGDHEGAIRLLGEVVLDPKSTSSNEQLAKSVLRSFVEE